MNFTDRPRRARASSARPSRQRSRPTSGNNRKNSPKLELIENLYGGLLGSKRSSQRAHGTKAVFGQTSSMAKLDHTKVYKQKEELVTENLQLRQQINKLKQELSLQRGKTEEMRRRSSEYTKQMNMEFSKERYWHGSQANMVRGIKSRYENLKQKYEQKCKQVENIIKKSQYSRQLELEQHLERLQEDSDRLVGVIKEASDQLTLAKHGTINSEVEQSIQQQNLHKFELQQKNKTLTKKVLSLKEKLQLQRSATEGRQKMVAYLDKLLIERDNAQHAAFRKQKKAQKQRHELMTEFQHYRKDKEQRIEGLQKQIEQNNRIFQKQSETERIIFRKEIETKSEHITKLQKQVAYLTTLLSYWKPLDQANHLATQKAVSVSHDDPSDTKEVVLEYSMNSTMLRANPSKNKTQHPEDEAVDARSRTGKSRRGSAADPTRNISDVMTKSIDLVKEKGPKKRVQVTSDFRNSEEGVKSRRVTQGQVLDICETLKYRFLGFHIDLEEIRKEFDFKPEVALCDNEQDQEWQSQYITMREVVTILMNPTFGLNDCDAHLLSRFLIEDSNKQYVYCDPNNQNLRTVVKSIIRNIIGQYDLPPNRTEVEQKTKKLLQKYSTNIEPALRASYPKGIITKRKLVEMFKGLGIELTKEIQDYIIGRLVISSHNLSSLSYSLLFDPAF